MEKKWSHKMLKNLLPAKGEGAVGGRHKIKLIALDLDGTTLNSRSQISEKTARALKMALEKDVHVVVATGRAMGTLPEEVREIEGIEYAITSNGAIITELATDRTVYRNFICREAVPAVYETLKDKEMLIEVFIDGEAYIEKRVYENVGNFGLSKSGEDYVISTRTPHRDLMNLMLENAHRIENINMCFKSEEDREAMRRELMELKNVSLTSSMYNNLEIIGKNTDKASAVGELCRWLKISEKEVMACGDNHNDMGMLQMAGIAVAMGNAVQELKELSHIITDTNDDDGVAKAVEYVLGL